MNPVKLRQILEARRAARAPPLIPPISCRNSNEPTIKKGAKEIIDIHLHLRNFCVRKNSDRTPIVCIFSQSEDNTSESWKMSTATEISFCETAKAMIKPIYQKNDNKNGFMHAKKDGKIPTEQFTCTASFVHLPDVFAVEFQLERNQLIKIDVCELLLTGCLSLGYTIFSISELVICKTGSITRSLIHDESGSVVANAIISCTLRPRPHSILMQFAAKNLIKKNMLSVNSTQIFFEIHRVESTSASPFTTILESANTSCNNFQQKNCEIKTSNTSSMLYVNDKEHITGKDLHSTYNINSSSNQQTNSGITDGFSICQTGISTLLAPTHTTTVLYRSECARYTSSRIVWRAFTLQSNEISGRVLEFVCLYRNTKTYKGLLGRFLTEYKQLKKGASPENIYFLIYENSRSQQKMCGIFELLRITQIALPSFLEYISTGCTLNFACAIDFSRAATTAAAEETAIRRYLDNVELVLRAIGDPLRYFNAGSNFPAFGFGAKIPPHYRESQEFCLNFSANPYCRGLDGVRNAFRNAFANVQPLNIAHLSHIIYSVAKLAQSAINRVQASNASTTSSSSAQSTNGSNIRDHPAYFLLLVITRGIFDDLKETVQSIIFASRAPISIVFVTIGEEITKVESGIISQLEMKTNKSDASPATLNQTNNFESPTHSIVNDASMHHYRKRTVTFAHELERLALAGTRLNYHGRRAERDCTQYVSLAQCRQEETNSIELSARIAERALINIPWQMSTWLTKYGFKANSSIIADPIRDVGVENSLNIEKSTNPTKSTSFSSLRRGIDSTNALTEYYGDDNDYNDDGNNNKIVGEVRRKSKILAANVGAQLRQLATRRCRGGICCRHAPSNAAFIDIEEKKLDNCV